MRRTDVPRSCCVVIVERKQNGKKREGFLLGLPRFWPNLCELYFLSRRLVFVLRYKFNPNLSAKHSERCTTKQTEIHTWKRSTKWAIDCKHAVLVVQLKIKKKYLKNVKVESCLLHVNNNFEKKSQGCYTVT